MANLRANAAKRAAARKPAPKPKPVRKAPAKKPVARRPTVNALRSRGAAARKTLGGAPAPNPGAGATSRKVFTVGSRTAENIAAQQNAQRMVSLSKNQKPFKDAEGNTFNLNDLGKRLAATVASNAEVLRAEQAKLPQVNEDATGEERAAQQEQLQKISDAQFKYTQSLKSLENNNRLRNDFSDAAATAGQPGVTAVNPITDTGSRKFATDANGNPIEQGGARDPNMGAIETSARDRLASQGVTGTPQNQQVTSGKAQGNAVLTYSGQGASYDRASGGPISSNAIGAFGAGRNQARAQQEKENLSAEFTRQTSEAAAAGQHYTSSQQQARLDALHAAQQEVDDKYATTGEEIEPGVPGAGAPGQEGDATTTNVGGKPVPDPNGFLASLDAAEKQTAATELAPLFDSVRNTYSGLQDNAADSRSMIKTLDAEIKEFTDIRRAQYAAMEAAQKQNAEDQKQQMLKSAERTYENQQALAELERQRTETEFNRAIRDQIIQNEEDRKMAFLGNGISGGWRSSLHTSLMIDALKKGERVVADLKTDKAFAGQISTQKLMEIEGNYHSNITEAYNAYNVSMAQLFERMDTKAAELDKTVFSSKQDSKKALNTLENDLFKEAAALTGNMITAAVTFQNTAKAQARLASQDMYAKQKDLTNEFFDGLDRGLHTDTRWYNSMVAKYSALGMTPPPRGLVTDEQRKEMKDGVEAVRYRPGQFKVGDVSYGDIMNNVSDKLPPDRGKAFRESAFALLESGDYNTAISKAIGSGVRALGVAVNQSFIGFDVGTQQIDVALQAARALEETGQSTGKWKTLFETTIKKQFQEPQDAAWIQFMQDMMLSQEEWRHSITGAQFTEMEKERVGTYLITPEDTVQNAVKKMVGLKSYMTLQRNSYANNALSSFGESRYSDDELFGDVNADVARQREYDEILNSPDDAPDETSYDYTPTSGVYEDSLPITQKDFTGWVARLGSVSQDFYEPTDYIAGRSSHGGLDIAGKRGQAIMPPVGGKIVKIDDGNSGWGKHIIWEDGAGNRHLAAHLDEIPLWMREQYELGDPIFISKTDVIGKMGSTGHSTGPHLHYEIRNKGGQLLNPYDYFSIT